jgi:ABC-type multidrug transport system fused ATPase/permease subunit
MHGLPVENILGTITLEFLIKKHLSLLAIGVGIIFAIFAFFQTKIVSKLTEQQLDAQSLATESAEEILSNIRTVHLFSQQRREKQRYSR